MFETLLGQEYVKRTLTDAVSTGHAGHAYLFCGPAGIGRKSFAAEFGRALMCRTPDADGNACGQCLSCRLMAAGTNPDYKLITGEEGKTGIGVETVRALEEDIVTAPSTGLRKIYVIDRSEKLTVQAQNALLKTIEEPPEYAMLIFICANPSLLIDTVRSRVTRLDFARNTREEVLQAYGEQSGKGAELTPEDRDLIAAYADGIIGRALQFTDFELFGRLREELFGAMTQLGVSGSSFLQRFTDALTGEDAAKNKEFVFFELTSFVRDAAMVARFGDDAPLQNSKYRYELDKLAACLGRHGCSRMLDRIGDAWLCVGQNVNYRSVAVNLAADFIYTAKTAKAAKEAREA